MKARRILASLAAAAVATSALAVAASAADYNAYISFQTTSYSFRNGWSDASYGKATDYFNSYIVWGKGDYPEETYPDYEDYFDYDLNGYALPAEYVDATITGDGEYTIEAKGLDWSVTGDTAFNLIQVTTDLPVDSPDDITLNTIKVTNAKVIVDGVEQVSVDNPVCEGSDYITVNLINGYNTEVEKFDCAFPAESLKIVLTVEGIDAAGGDAGDAEGGDTGAGDVDGETDGGKDSPDTGIEDVAVVAGLAIVAGGAIAITRRRK